jgi:hypothetical protein
MGSSPKITSTQESMDAVMKAMTENVGPYAEAVRQIIGPTEQAKVDANRMILPQQNALQYEQMREFLPKYTDIDLANAKARAVGTVNQDTAALNQAKASGLVANALDLQKTADPEYYKNRELLSGKLGQMAAFDPNKLSGSEVAQINRGLNQTSMGAPNLGAALQAASTFGSALAKRRGENQSYTQTIAGALPMMRSGFDPYQVATGKNSGPGQAAMGNRTYDNTMGQTASGYAGNIFNQASQFQGQQNQQAFQAPTGLDTAMKVAGGVGGMMAGI